MAKFEAHLTAHIKDAVAVKDIGESCGIGWKFSRIEGDALMGPKPYCYLTAYRPDGQELLCVVKATVAMLKAVGIEILREKIEQIVYDTKTGVDELTHGRSG